MNFIKKNKTYIINVSFIICIFLLILVISDTSPFGEYTIGKSDAIVQFKPMLFNFITKLKTGTLLNYSFSNGLGNAFIFDFLYYLASPFNLIALFFNNPDLMYLSSLIVRIAITSIFMTFYVQKKTDNFLIIFISTISYVFSGWFLAYYYYLPWLDIFMIFPLFNYGLEQLINKKKYHIYILTLSYMISTNLYLSFPVCIYTLLYFIIYELLYKKDQIKKKIISFDYITLATLVSFLISFFYLYAWYDSIIKMRLAFDNSVTTSYTVTFLDFIKSLYYGNISLITESSGSTFPNIGCSILILLCSFHYFLNGKISKKNKLYSLLVILITVLFINIPKLDFIMNAFHNVRGLSFRYSFIISFLLIKLFIEDTKSFDSNKKNYYMAYAIVILLLIVVFKNISPLIRVLNIVFILTNLIILIFYNRSSKLLIYPLFILEIFITSFSNIPNVVNSNDLPNNIKYNKINMDYRLVNTGIDNDYFNVNLYFNKKVTNIMTSMTYTPIINLLKNLGCLTFENTSATCSLNNDIANLLLNVKTYNNDYYLQKVYAVKANIEDCILDENNIKNNIENIIYNMTSIKDVFDKHEIKGVLKDDRYFFDVNYDYYYIEVLNDLGGTSTYSQTYRKYSQDSEYGSDISIIYTLNEDKLKEIYEYLKKNQIKYTYYNDNHIKGTINIDKDQLIFTSIPYDKDWEVKVDGKKVKTIELLDSLLGIEVSPGKHDIELEYKSHYLIPAIISIITLILLIIDWRFNILSRFKKN